MSDKPLPDIWLNLESCSGGTIKCATDLSANPANRRIYARYVRYIPASRVEQLRETLRNARDVLDDFQKDRFGEPVVPFMNIIAEIDTILSEPGPRSDTLEPVVSENVAVTDEPGPGSETGET